MGKTLFEKLTCVGESITLQQSVTDNINRILNCGGVLDAVDNGESGGVVLNSIYRNGLAAVVDQPSVNSAQQDQYRANLVKLLLQFEPRLKSVSVNHFINQGLQSVCSLKIELSCGEFEQEFVFKQVV
ncbi:MAG: hypothetical protein HRT35_21830 [Algicola sp.]|nr:hypothetical protein [Algicola sp.]